MMATRRIRRILVAVKNPSAAALPAVNKAAQLAKALGADLTLFQALSTPLNLSDDLPPRQMVLGSLENYTRSAHEACLKGLALRLRRRGIRVSVSAEWDHPADDAILREAARVRADLIVVEAHPRHHGASSFLRLTDWELLRRSPVPLLLVKRPGPYRRPSVLAALDPDHTFDKPVSLDAEILAVGATIASALSGSLHAVHAYAPVMPADTTQGVISAAKLAATQTQAAAHARQKLARATRGSGIPKSRRHVSGRHVPDAIEEVATEIRSSIVVLGAVARSGLKRLLIGNTAERVLDHLSSDVLLVKPGLAARRVNPKVAIAQAAAPPAPRT
jgi:universal stress protein E